MSRHRTACCVLLLAGLAAVGFCDWAAAAEPLAQLRGWVEGQVDKLLEERDRLWEETQRLQSEGKLDEAAAAAEKMLAIERIVLTRKDKKRGQEKGTQLFFSPHPKTGQEKSCVPNGMKLGRKSLGEQLLAKLSSW